MSVIDSILGRGALDARFTDWDTARNFVIFDAIVNNPRLSDETKVKLQDIEQEAYETTSGQWLASETQEIGEYYNYLKNNFPSVTNDQRFLAIFDSADEVKASEPSVSLDDVSDVAKKGGMSIALLALAGIGFLYLREK